MLLRSLLESAEHQILEDPVFQEDLIQTLVTEVALLERPGGGHIFSKTKAPRPPGPKPAPTGANHAPPIPSAHPAPTQAAAPPTSAPPAAAPPKPKAKKPAAPAPAPQRPPNTVRRCPVGSRKDPKTGQCRDLSTSERHGLKAASFSRSAQYHQDQVRDGGFDRTHSAALTHQGNAHAALGMHHAHMRRLQAAKNDIQRHYHQSKADEYMQQAQKHLDRRNKVMSKMGQPGLGRRIINRIGSLFTRPQPAPGHSGS